MRLSNFLAVLAVAAGSVRAHMEMIDPFPILSPANPAVHWSDKNYDMMAPLLWTGDNLPYPCKGYLWSTPAKERVVQKTWPAGSWQSVTLGPNGAPHKGGSCQLSLSYDYGRTWQVILSLIGGCPIDSYRMDFELPAEAPSGEAVLSWSWLNHEGNREFYQNCAIISVTGGGAGLPTRDYPPPFVANAGVNGCSTIEGVDPVFPNPGKNVRFGGPYRGQWITEQRGIRGTNCVDQHAGETPAGSRGRTGYEVEVTPSSSSTTSSSTTTSSSSTTTLETTTTPSSTATTSPTTTAASSTNMAEAAPTSAIGSEHIASPLPVEPASSTTSSTSTAAPSPTTTSPAASSTTEASSITSSVSTTSTTESLPSPSSTTEALPSTTSTTELVPSTTTTSEALPSTSSTTESLPTTTSTSETLPLTTSTIETTSSSSTTTVAATSPTTAPTLSPGGPTCVRRAKRSHFDSALHPGRHVRLVRRAVKQKVMTA